MIEVSRTRSLAYRPDIDGLRATAVLLVLAYHAFPEICPAGFVGVDVFFVISGYLITKILVGEDGVEPLGLKEFYGRRVRRIFPALLTVLVVTSLFGYLMLLPHEYRALSKYVAAGASFISNFVIWRETGYFEKSIELMPLMHLWSLAIEEQFYIVWPILVVALRKGVQSRRTIKWMAIVLLGASFSYSAYLANMDGTAGYYSPLSRAWELLAGAVLALRVGNEARELTRAQVDVCSILSFTVLLLAAFWVVQKVSFPVWGGMLPVGAAFFLIAYGQHGWFGQVVLGNSGLVYIGKISYPLYLWHWVALSFLRIEDGNPTWIYRALALALSVALAVATYHLVERRLQRMNVQKLSLKLAGLMFCIFVFGLTEYRYEVLKVYPTAMQKALATEYDPRPAYRFKKCFLDSVTQTSRDFAAECMEDTQLTDYRVLLWGDSLAAQLLPGVKSQQERYGFTLSQRTASSCPPATDLGYGDRGNCNEINLATMRYVEQSRPDVVLINGRWPLVDAEAESRLTKLVVFLRSQQVKKVVLFGPTPDWLPDIRSLLIKQRFPGGVIPEFMTPPAGAWAATQAENLRLRRFARKLGVVYIEPIEYLCRESECLVRVSNDIPAGLIASDHDHMTAQASVFLFRQRGVSSALER